MAEGEVRYCSARDGTRLSYAVVGHGKPELVWMPAWGFGDHQALWANPLTRRFYEAIARFGTVLVAGRRGAGQLRLEVQSLSMQEQVDDLSTIVEDAGLTTFDILAMDEGASVAVTYLCSNGAPVRRMMLWAPYAKAGGAGDQKVTATLNLIRDNWPMARRMFADANLPSGDSGTRRWVAEYFKSGFAPRTVETYFKFAADADVSALLPRINIPVLVLQRRDDRLTPFRVGQTAASMIPRAQLVGLTGDEHAPFFGEQDYLNVMAKFLGSNQMPAHDAALRTILFTDLVGHTEMMRRLGDERGREVLREHERITRDLLKQHGGAEVKTMGDGFLASFGSVTKAMDCAIALQRAFASHTESMPEPLQVRVGLNAGEPIEEDGDLFGSTVIMASRIAAKAGAGEILIPEPLRHLLTGKSYVYADRGETVLKGFEDAVRLYEVRWRE